MDVKATAEMWAARGEIRKYLSDPVLYTQLWAVRNELQFSLYGQNKIKREGKISQESVEMLFNHLWLDYEKELRAYKENLGPAAKLTDYKVDEIKESTMLKAMEVLRHKSIVAQKQAIIDSLAYSGDNDAPLADWVKAVTGKQNSVDLAIMKHFLWTVKRRMKGIAPIYIKLPVIYGSKQQTGKSTAIRKLLGPINAFRLDRRVSEVLDERNFKALGEFYVCFLDEMAGMLKAETEALKHVITADYLTFRPMRTNHNETIFVTCSFIGASNKPLREMISDHTGQARFWEIEASDTIDHSVINSINYLEVWKSIDENLPEGYIKPYLYEVAKVQEAETIQDALDLFLQDCRYEPGVCEKFISNQKMYLAYQEFCAKMGERTALSNIWFGRRLKRFKLKQGTRHNVRGYFVNKEFLGGNEGEALKLEEQECDKRLSS